MEFRWSLGFQMLAKFTDCMLKEIIFIKIILSNCMIIWKKKFLQTMYRLPEHSTFQVLSGFKSGFCCCSGLLVVVIAGKV